jgi:hypothetical protein
MTSSVFAISAENLAIHTPIAKTMAVTSYLFSVKHVPKN